tara:strand:- start:229 stop:474 length:246 start_codon:yes stop_codon:yes gene_type:complete
MSYSDAQAKKIIGNIESSYDVKREGDKLKIIDIDGKKVGTIKGDVTEKKIRTIMGMKMGGKVQTEYRGGGRVNLGNFKGQF